MKAILSVLKIILPLAFGVFLIWYVFKDLSKAELDELKLAFSQANYWWILASVCFGILSHMSRAIRWKYTIQPLGKTPGFWNSFFTVMIGYVANLALPRLGEVTRPGMLGKYEGLPFNKLFGTIVAERVADLIILGSIILLVVITELDMLRELLMGLLLEGSGKFNATSLVIVGIAILLLGTLFFYLLFTKSQHPILVKIRGLVKGVFEGIQSILKMENKWPFLIHTVFIWIMYIAMFSVCFYSLEETSDAPFASVLASFVMGSLAIVFVQGGLGVFPIAIMETLILYGLPKTSSLALGWILWSSQTLMVIVLGVVSLVLIRIINKKPDGEIVTA